MTNNTLQTHGTNTNPMTLRRGTNEDTEQIKQGGLGIETNGTNTYTSITPTSWLSAVTAVYNTR